MPEKLSELLKNSTSFRLAIVSLVMLVVDAGASTGFTAGQTPADHAIAYRTAARSSIENEQSPRSRHHQSELNLGPGFEFYEAAVRLIRAHYCAEVGDEKIFRDPLDKLSFVLLPQCTEDLELPTDCSDDLDKCFVAAVNLISESCHVGKDKILRLALTMLLRDLDPNSSLLDSDMLNELQITTSGRFGGVGMVVSPRDGDYVVVSSFEGSPAAKAGVQAGDVILEIDGTPLHGLPLHEVLRMVRGPAGSRMSVSLRSAKTGRIGRLTLKRQIIRIPPVRYVRLPGSIGYLRIVNFQKDTAQQVRKALDNLLDYRRRGMKGLILDLRDNPGGLFDEAIRVANLFVSSGMITLVKGRDPRFNRQYFADGNGKLPVLSTVVLINKGSASASEILTGALQGRSRVLVLGEKSFGKASVQAVFPLSDGSALRLTSAHYYTSDGRDIDGKGLEPDFQVDSPQELTMPKVIALRPEELEADPEVKAAMEYLLHGRYPGKTPFASWY